MVQKGEKQKDAHATRLCCQDGAAQRHQIRSSNREEEKLGASHFPKSPHGAPAPPGPHYPQASVCRSVPVCIPGSWAPLGPCPPRRAGGWMLGVAGPTWANYQLTPALPCPAALSQLDTPPALFCRPGVCERLHGLQCTHTQAHTHLHIQYRHSQIEAHAHTHTAQQLWAEPQSDQVSMELSWGGQGDLSAPSLWWGRIVPMGRG